MPYLRLMRFHFHISFISVLAGAFLFSPPGARFPLQALVQCYILFNVLLYGALYTFNDIVDAGADAAHPTKKNRPLPSGQLGIGSAAIFCALLATTSLYFSWRLFPKDVLLVMLAFIAANATYTLALKRIPYAGLSVIALTHTLRLVLGISIAGGAFDPYFCAAFYALLFCITVTVHGTYNVKSDEEKHYPRRALITCQFTCAAFIAGLAASAGRFTFPWQVLVAVFFLFALGSHIRFLRRPIALLFMTKEKRN